MEPGIRQSLRRHVGEDARDVVALGADAIGVIFADVASPRHRRARLGNSRRDAGLGVRCGVFRDNQDEESSSYARDFSTSTSSSCTGRSVPSCTTNFGTPRVHIVKALNIDDEEFDLFDESRVDAVLVDGPRPGSGSAHSWDRLHARPFSVPVIAAGGLTARTSLTL